MLIEAKYYQVLENKKIRCTLCPHECILFCDKIGICKTRKNIDGKLFSLAYANPSAVSIDPVEKKPLLHFSPSTQTFSLATAGCSLFCKNCQNSNISQVSPLQTKNYNLLPEQIVDLALKNNCQSISYTYTEPFVFYEYMLETAALAKKQSLKNIIVSSGYVNKKPLLELIPFLDAANIDLKSFDNADYKKMSGASLQPVLDTLIELKKANVWLEITNLIIPSFNDDAEMISNMCNWLVDNGFEDIPLHFSKFFPTYKLLNYRPTSNDKIEEAITIAKAAGVKYVYSGNIYGHKNENTYCSGCGYLIIEREGFSVLNNYISKGKCSNCNHKIPGVWS
ncbi:MAG: AmmeMemoRadiSam system radical SAM enzyme [Bacteroidales bacterium]|nr:AmmeMemoRadiSam system radical SAM enzyme [Bacteroidales bacterium]